LILATDLAVAPVVLVLVNVTRYFEPFFNDFLSGIVNLPAAVAVAVPLEAVLQVVLPFFFEQLSTLATIVPGPLTLTDSFFALPLTPVTLGATAAAGIGSTGFAALKVVVSGVNST
jgi:hypothetical protein